MRFPVSLSDSVASSTDWKSTVFRTTKLVLKGGAIPCFVVNTVYDNNKNREHLFLGVYLKVVNIFLLKLPDLFG